LDAQQLLSSVAIGFLAVMWYELVKIGTRLKGENNKSSHSTTKAQNAIT
jgi:hypothetical protein